MSFGRQSLQIVSMTLVSIALLGCQIETNQTANNTRSTVAAYGLNTEHFREIVGDVYNPDRGFYRQLGDDDRRYVSSDIFLANASYLRRSARNADLDKSSSIMKLYLDLSQFREAPLSDEYLRYVESVLIRAQNVGKTLIPRWTYDIPTSADYAAPDENCSDYCVDNSDSAKIAEIDLIEEHIDQLSEIINRHSSAISFIEVGLLGFWGEWHGGPSGDSYSDRLHPNRRRVMSRWLETTNDDIYFALRYPKDYKRLRNIDDFERVGLHHDCPNYVNDQYPGEGIVARYAPQGGEVCQIAAKTNYDCPTMIRYFERFQFDVLNASDWTGSNSRFEAQGCLTEIRNRLGYRFVIRGSKFVDGVLEFSVENTGFGKSFKNRMVSIRIDGRIVETHVDVKDWKPGTTSIVSVNIGQTSAEYIEIVVEDNIKFANATGNKVFLN